MFWKITCYNGDTWTSKTQQSATDAIEQFIADTGKTQWDIKSIENQH